MNLVAIDTLRLFPTALECAKLVEEKYGKKAGPRQVHGLWLRVWAAGGN